MKLLSGLLLLATGGGAFFFPGQDPSPIRIDHPDPKFRMTLPAGYQPAAVTPPGAAYSYQRPGEAPLALSIEPLNGRIDPGGDESGIQAATLRQLPPGAQVRLTHEAWGPYEVLVVESTFTTRGVEVFALAAQVPILPRAIQIVIAGRKSTEAQARADLKEVLGTLRGKTHWLTPTQRLLAISAGGISILGWLLLAVYGILYLTMYKGNVLRHWRFRLCFLTAAVFALSTSIVVYVVYGVTKGDSPMDVTFYFLVAVAGATAVKTGDLYNKGLNLRKAAAAPSPPPAA